MASSEDIAYDILSWLPAKAIYRFKSVSKSLSKLCEEPTFITKQVEKSLANNNTCIFIQPDMYETNKRRKVIELHTLSKNQQPSSGASDDFLTSLSKSARVLSSSNGLILCATNERPIKLFICNPVTKSISSVIPNPWSFHRDPYSHDDLIILLECHQGVDDYSLFHFVRTNDLYPWYRCNVYKAKEGAWQTLKGFYFMGGRNRRFDTMPVFHNGLCYTISAGYNYYWRSYIVSHDLEKRQARVLRLPKPLATKRSRRPKPRDISDNMSARIFKWGNVSSSTRSICLVNFDKSIFTIWFLKDCESNSVSWQKLLEVGVETMGVKEKDPLIKSYMVVNGDRLIFATEKKVYSYGLAGKKCMMLEEICEHNCGSNPYFVSYLDTLRPCGIGTASLPS